VLDEVQSESPVGALVRTRPLTVPAVRDMGLSQPDEDVIRGCGSGVGRMYCVSPGARESWGVTNSRVEAIRFHLHEPRWSCRLVQTGIHPRRSLGLIIKKWAC
jgi:hypothetical protein